MCSIEAFVARFDRPLVSTLQQDEVESFVSSDDIVIIASMPDSDARFLSTFIDFAYGHRDRYTFAVMEAESTSVTCANKVDSVQHSTTDTENVKSLHELLQICTEPLIPALTRRNEMSYIGVSAARVDPARLLTRPGRQVFSVLLYRQRQRLRGIR